MDQHAYIHTYQTLKLKIRLTHFMFYFAVLVRFLSLNSNDYNDTEQITEKNYLYGFSVS